MLMPAPSDAARPTTNASQLLWVANAAANTGASVDTEPSIRPASPGCTTCSTNSRRFASSSSFLASAAQLLLFQFFGPVLVDAFFLRKIVQQLPGVGVLRARRGFLIKPPALDFHGGRLLADRFQPQLAA